MNIQPDIKHDSVGKDDGSHGGEDFVLTGKSAWIRIDDYSLYIYNKKCDRTGEEQIHVSLHNLGDEAKDSLVEFNFEKDLTLT